MHTETHSKQAAVRSARLTLAAENRFAATVSVRRSSCWYSLGI